LLWVRFLLNRAIVRIIILARRWAGITNKNGKRKVKGNEKKVSSESGAKMEIDGLLVVPE